MRVEKFTLLAFLALLFAVVQPTVQSPAHEDHDHNEEMPRWLWHAQASANPGKPVKLQLASECKKFQGDCGKVQFAKPPRPREQLPLQGTEVGPEKALQRDVVKDAISMLDSAWRLTRQLHINGLSYHFHGDENTNNLLVGSGLTWDIKRLSFNHSFLPDLIMAFDGNVF